MSAWPPEVFRRRCPRFFGVTASKQYHHGHTASLHANDTTTTTTTTGSTAALVDGDGGFGADRSSISDTNTKDCESYPPMLPETRWVGYARMCTHVHACTWVLPHDYLASKTQAPNRSKPSAMTRSRI
jgi:hypothetical protein